MNRLLAWDHLAVAVLLSVLALGSASCTSAGKCMRGTIGCACTTDDDCDEGADCVGGMCVEDESPNDDDAGASDAGPPPDCMGMNLMDACQQFCEAFCQNQVRHCIESSCDPGECDEGGTLLDSCFDNADTAADARALCRDQIGRECENFGFREEDDNGNNVFVSACFEDDPQCVLDPDRGCSNTCGEGRNDTGGDLADNGRCEDTGQDSEQQLCPRGTDCSDCGPRPCTMIEEECENHGDCCGFFSDRALCISAGARSLCLALCESDEDCPNDGTCSGVEGDARRVCVPSAL